MNLHIQKVYIYICRLCINSWQELENGNITFAEELDFEVDELERVYENNDKI